MTSVSPEVAADRERMKAILALPEAGGSNYRAAVAVALEGATVDEARAVLQVVNNVMTPDEVAESINKQTKACG
jgi:hypothetical protein